MTVPVDLNRRHERVKKMKLIDLFEVIRNQRAELASGKITTPTHICSTMQVPCNAARLGLRVVE